MNAVFQLETAQKGVPRKIIRELTGKAFDYFI
jgi:hypothetical protein